MHQEQRKEFDCDLKLLLNRYSLNASSIQSEPKFRKVEWEVILFESFPEIEIFEIFQQSKNAIFKVAQSVSIKLKSC